ncbi:cytochrome P450 [Desarmillaria tabescens]|uniref:Cytochrome P450 n=1 Tax=Armillaria tabescens TaxID=1929756 RepID=A0AA39NQ43_ARMTA|nr:cytochrome P450 [Desarmillaria tabescens]KAK0469549.1 cytochrome P450 [Desarmillaria tabescens]
MLHMYSIPLVTSLAFVIFLFYRRLRNSFGLGSLPFPPGPKGLPLIRNLWDIPTEHQWLTYSRWSATYGDVLFLNSPGNKTIVLNSSQAATELLEKRSGNYSDRPDLNMMNLTGWNFSLAFMRYSDRTHRRMFHQYFQPRAILAYYPVQTKATLVLLQQLLKSPDECFHHVRHHAGSIIMKTVYGYDVEPNGDRFVHLADQALTSIRVAGAEGTFLVDYLPILKYIPDWFPGAKFKKLAQTWSKDVEDMKEEPFKYASESLANGIASPSFVSENLKRLKETRPSDYEAQTEIIKNAAGVAFGAGADTTVSTVLSAILAFVLYPEVLVKAQAELDAVVGQSRLPNFDDRPQLPYIEAVLYEALRWNPVVPLSIPHRSVKDDVYKGYYIPAGATIIANTWAILHNEKDYPGTLKFNPERFIKQEGKELPPDPMAAFGYGRRICPGRYLALNTAWIAIAYIASTLSVTKAAGSDGQLIEPSDTFSGGFLSLPLSFKCSFKARSAQAQELIDSEFGIAMGGN